MFWKIGKDAQALIQTLRFPMGRLSGVIIIYRKLSVITSGRQVTAERGRFKWMVHQPSEQHGNFTGNLQSQAGISDFGPCLVESHRDSLICGINNVSFMKGYCLGKAHASKLCLYHEELGEAAQEPPPLPATDGRGKQRSGGHHIGN